MLQLALYCKQTMKLDLLASFSSQLALHLRNPTHAVVFTVHATCTMASLLVIATLGFMAKNANLVMVFARQLILTAVVHMENVTKDRAIASILTLVQNVNYLLVLMTVRATAFVSTRLAAHPLAFACMALRASFVKTLVVVRHLTAMETVLVIETLLAHSN